MEKRKAERRQVNLEFVSISDFISEYVSNISETGAFIRSDDPLPVGTKVDLRFSVIADDIEIIEGIGEVMRVVEPGGKNEAGMGVVFIDLTKASQSLVKRLLTR